MGKGFRMSIAEMIYVGLSWEEENVLGMGAFYTGFLLGSSDFITW